MTPNRSDVGDEADHGDDADGLEAGPGGAGGDLTGRQRRHLRTLGYGFKPTVSVGRAGVTPPVVQTVAEGYHTAELVKARLERSCQLDRHEAARQLATATGSHLVQVLGRTVLLYRPDPESPHIVLPD